MVAERLDTRFGRDVRLNRDSGASDILDSPNRSAGALFVGVVVHHDIHALGA